MLFENMKYCYDDINIMPSFKTEITTRKECNPFKIDKMAADDGNDYLPIFTAPMSTVVNKENFNKWSNNHIIPILPRNIDFETRLNYIKHSKWVAVSWNEFVELFVEKDTRLPVYTTQPYRILIDVANGHMKILFENIKKAKKIYDRKLIVMMGNIANPDTYQLCCDAHVDFVRVGIGGGEGCLTTTNTGVGYPMASLISEMISVRSRVKWDKGITYEEMPKIIADGNIRGYADVNKALALGADYVMIGGLFARLIESASPCFAYDKEGNIFIVDHPVEHIVEIGGVFLMENEEDEEKEYIVDKLYKRFYGMASRAGQNDLQGGKFKTSEGCEKTVEVTTNLHKWSQNMIDYMKSAMSYCGIKNIKSFASPNVNCIVVSEKAQQRINQ